MAQGFISASNITSGTTTNASSASTASITPVANRLYLISIASRTGISTQPNTPTVTGGGLTWVQVNTIYFDTDSSSRKTITTLRALGASPSAGALTIDFASQTQTDICWAVDEFRGMDKTGTNGSGAIVQSVTNKDEASGGGTLTVTLGAFGSANNATYGAFAADPGTGSMTAKTGFTKLVEFDAGAVMEAGTEFLISNDTSVQAIFDLVAGTKMGGIAIEIKAAGIAFDATAISTDQSSSPITWNHTCTGTNRLLVVGVVLTATTSAPSTTGVTYNNVAMTKIRADTRNAANSIIESSIWFLSAPATGSNQVSATFSGGTLPRGAGISASYTNAQQSNNADASNGTNGTASGDQTFTVTTVADNCAVFAVGINAATTSPTMVADQTSRGTVNLAATIAAILRGSDTNSVVTPAGSKAMGFVIGGTGLADWAMTGASFAPFAAVGGNDWPVFQSSGFMSWRFSG